MAVVSLLKGLYHWALVCGIASVKPAAFEIRSIAWQAATVFFAVIDLVAAVGLWLAAAWGAVIWLTAVGLDGGGRAVLPAGLRRRLGCRSLLEGGLLADLSLARAEVGAGASGNRQRGGTSWRGSDSSGSAIWACRWRKTSSRPGIRSKASTSIAAAVESSRRPAARRVETAKTAAARAEVVITMLPAGKAGARGLSRRRRHHRMRMPGTLLIDCSTIDVETARAVAQAAEQKGSADARRAGVRRRRRREGGHAHLHGRRQRRRLSRAREPILEKMGKTIVHAGGAGNGQAAKICNNMILGVSMIAVSEAFVLAEKLGLDAQKLFDISSKSSGQCWSMTSYCPVPGPVPTSPANRDYQAGFTAAMMLKDLKLAQDAAKACRRQDQLGADAARSTRICWQSGGGTGAIFPASFGFYGADADFQSRTKPCELAFRKIERSN